jgi:uncharacterized protein YkwD
VQHTRKLIATALTALGLALLTSFVAALPAAATPRRSAHARTAHHTRNAQRARARRIRRARRLRRIRTRAAHLRSETRTRNHRVAAVKPDAAKPDSVKPDAVKPDALPPASTSEDAPERGSAASLAAILTTPCLGTAVTPEEGNLPEVRAAVLCLINRVRAEHGENPLVENKELDAAAEGHADELVADDYFAHVAPDGTTPVDRIRSTGYIPGPEVGYVIGENLAWGTFTLSTPQAIVEAWLASPGHLANILESNYHDTGIGIIASVPSSLSGGAPGATYAQEFGVIEH